ncbi:sulfatase-like hydrolase/transferase [Paraclostridium bifermentans]|uniref:Sulfatase-like hydrolase/transferase n=1 Tax=Paraclostridium bifermentans TaxID=1490 RepID=A0ABY8R1Y1_PARBF|nr:sulfatase-like hydrolase/transferase [Paraclostridium bifermentans]
MNNPNFLFILVDELRYEPIYESEEIISWKKNNLCSQEFLKENGLEFKNHYVGSTACSPSRGTLYTGQYPSLHGVTQTPGVAKQISDPDYFG